MGAVRRSKIAANSDDTLAMELNITPLPHNNDERPSYQPPTSMQMTTLLQPAPTHSPSLPQSHTPLPVPRSSVRRPPKAYAPVEMEETCPESPTSGRPSLQARSYQPPSMFPAQEVRGGASVRLLGSLRRTNSMHSASGYSSAFAPTDVYECIFQPMTMLSSAPAWTTDMQSQQNSVGVPLTRKTSTAIREALAPETYVKPRPQWKPQPHRVPQPQWKPVMSHIRQRANSDSWSSGPSVPTPPTPSVIRPPPTLRINTTHLLTHSYSISAQSDSESGSVTSGPTAPPGLDSPLVAPLNFKRIEGLRKESDDGTPPVQVVPPTLSSAVPPEVPPRSPLRPIVM